MATLTITQTEDYRDGNPAIPANTDFIVFNVSGASAVATFGSNQFGGSGIDNNVLFSCDSKVNGIRVSLTATGTFSAEGWNITNFDSSAGDSIGITGTSGADTITGSFEADNITSGGGADHLSGGGGDDLFDVATGDVVAGETIDGGTGNDTLLISGIVDLTEVGTTLVDVETVRFVSNLATLTASGTHFGGAGDITKIDSDGSTTQSIIVNGNSVDLSSLSFTGWGNAQQTIAINGTNATINLLAGSSEKDTINGGPGTAVDGIRGGGGADTLNGGDGDDTFFYNAAGEVQAGETITGGAGSDTISLANAGSSDFSGATIAGIETVDFQSGNSTAIFSGSQLGAGKIAIVSGSTGVDTFVVNAASDVNLSGVTFNSWTPNVDSIAINGTASGETLTGSAQDDTITGGGGADTLRGNNGNDAFRYTSGAEVVNGESMDGQGGTDKLLLVDTGDISFANITITSVERLEYSGSGASTATFTVGQVGLFATVTGSNGTNALVLENASNVDLSAKTFNSWTDGVDTITINGGSVGDSLTGSAKNDIIIGAAGADTLSGDDGNDIVRYIAAGEVGGGEVIDGGAGTDTIQLVNAGSNNFLLASSITSIEALDFESGASTAIFFGTQFGAGKITAVSGSAGTDTLIVDAASDVDLSGVTFTSWTDGIDTITINGTAAGETLTGSSKNDTINGGGGSDTMNGGGGNDNIFVDNALDVVNEAVGGGSDRVFASLSYTLKSGQEIEKLTTDSNGGTGAINLSGNDLANTIFGNAGANSLDGKGGADDLNGLGGDDFYFVDNALDVVNEASSSGNDRVFASVSYTLKAGQAIEKLTTDSNGGTGAINLTGNERADTIFGNAGANSLDGKGGVDNLSGLGGDDFYFVDNALDVVNEAASSGNDRVFASVSYTLKAGQAIEKLTTDNNAGSGAINLTGNELADIIFGNAGANSLDGKGGADNLNGLGGDDLYFVDNALDVVNEAAGGGTDRVFASVSYTLKTGQAIEKLTTDNNAGTGLIDLTGNETANTIFGNNGTNFVNGGAGNDTLVGLGGTDRFVFNTALNATTNHDTISDLVLGVDHIQLAKSVFSLLTGNAADTLAAGEFVSGAGLTNAQDANDRIVYNTTTGDLFYDSNGTAAGATLFATLFNHATVNNAVFLLG